MSIHWIKCNDCPLQSGDRVRPPTDAGLQYWDDPKEEVEEEDDEDGSDEEGHDELDADFD